MRRLFTISFFLCMAAFPAITPASDLVSKFNNAIDWSADRPLHFDDFTGSPDREGLAALTSSAIEVEYTITLERVNANVSARFFPERSWMRKNARNSYVLEHEQLHFDITEWHARLLRKTIASLYPIPPEEKELQSVIQQYLQAWQETQAKYDKETRHGLDKAEQQRWKSIIADALEENKEYATE